MDPTRRPVFRSRTVAQRRLTLPDDEGQPFEVVIVAPPFSAFEKAWQDGGATTSQLVAEHMLYLSYDEKVRTGELVFPGAAQLGDWILNHYDDWKAVQSAVGELLEPMVEILGKATKGEEESSASSNSAPSPANATATEGSAIPLSNGILMTSTSGPDSDGSFESPESVAATSGSAPNSP